MELPPAFAAAAPPPPPPPPPPPAPRPRQQPSSRPGSFELPPSSKGTAGATTIPDLSTPHKGHNKATPPRRRSSAAGFAPAGPPALLAGDGSRNRVPVDSRPPRARSPRLPLPGGPGAPSQRLSSLPPVPAPLTTASPAGTPSTAGHFAPNHTAPIANHAVDYFSSRPPAPSPPHSSSPSQRPPSRTRPDRVLGPSPLGTPPVGAHEGEPRHRPSLSTSTARPPTSHRPSTSVSASASASTSASTTAATARHRPSASRDHDPRYRSESNASTGPDDAHQGTPPRTRERREKDKKTMLSRALQQANTAVLLDNAQNFEGAIEAYSDACNLLQQVMIRSSGEEDRRKLDSIRITYTSRIEELKRLDPGYHHPTERPLPARPMSNDSLGEHPSVMFTDADYEPAIIQTASVTRIINDRSLEEPPAQSLPLRQGQHGGVRESVITTAIHDVQRTLPDNSSFLLQPPPGKLGNGLSPSAASGLESPMDRSYMPPPLSPRRPMSPLPPPKMDVDLPASDNLAPPQPNHQSSHKRVNSSESTSWLDTIDESGGSSCSSSVHSLSSGRIHRKHIRNPSGETEAEFDAALDAAVEAAYDEGYEPYEDEPEPESEVLSARLRNVESAKEKVREAERDEMIAAAKFRYNESQLRNQTLPHVRESAEFNLQDEAEEEERLLDEMTREYMLDGFDFDLKSKSSLPRQSDSSGLSGSTYISSHRTTAGTSLSTVAEAMNESLQKAPLHLPPPVPPPATPLPPIAASRTLANDAAQAPHALPGTAKEPSSVQSRRLSGQHLRALKIETSLPPIPGAPHTEKPILPDKDELPELPTLPKTATGGTFSSAVNTPDSTDQPPVLSQTQQQSGLSIPAHQPLLPSPADTNLTISPATPALGHAISNDSALLPPSPKTTKGATLGALKKNKSSLSLKQRTLSISSPDGSDASIGTPLSTTFSLTGARKHSIAAPVSTPLIPTFNVDGLPSGGMHLFESDIHSPYLPGTPDETVAHAPMPLEPCPDSYLLRPFWLMRCIYQTLAHPRGGYLSTKLFVPRDVWRVKGVKLKNVDDKIANCDFLTAALQRLATVDTLDADAVLEEMQALEVVLDQVQTQLAKKLGNEVGVHGVSTLFKDATTVGTGAAAGDHNSEKGSHGSQDHAPKSAVAQGKSYLASWRKLRSKNSALGLDKLAGGTSSGGTGGASAAKITSGDAPKETLTMATLPMTSLSTIKPAKRDVGSVNFEGVNAGYMGSLARLCDAVQILDQIARQVEDPGLKHSSPTHVGLELSARHAAEFFGFYVCRFVLNDISLMLDKFVKRGSEWVLV